MTLVDLYRSLLRHTEEIDFNELQITGHLQGRLARAALQYPDDLATERRSYRQEALASGTAALATLIENVKRLRGRRWLTRRGVAALLAPGAVYLALTLLPGLPAPLAVMLGLLAAGVVLVYTAMRRVALRQTENSLLAGASLGALIVVVAAFLDDRVQILDAAIILLYVLAVSLTALVSSIDRRRRADRLLDGADIGAIGVTLALLVTVLRAADLLLPTAIVVICAAVVLLAAVVLRALPAQWRRGPLVAIALAVTLTGIVPGYAVLVGGVRGLSGPHPTDLTVPFGWQAPLALFLLGVAASVVLPRRRGPWVSATAIALAVVGLPPALGWSWWAAIVVGLVVGACYAVAATVAVDAVAGRARLAAATVISLHALASSFALVWAVAAVMAIIALIGAVSAGFAAAIDKMVVGEGQVPPAHLETVRNLGLTAALCATAGALAAFTIYLGSATDAALLAALLTIASWVVIAQAVRPVAPAILVSAVAAACLVGVAVAVAALTTGRQAGIYAAGALLLVGVAELQRTSGGRPPRLPSWPRLSARRRDHTDDTDVPRVRPWPIWLRVMVGALTLIAVISLLPALGKALLVQFQALTNIWEGPPNPLPQPDSRADGLTALLLALSALLASARTSSRSTSRALIAAPGLVLAVVVTPASLGLAWPVLVLSWLVVFAVCTLSVAWTLPPEPKNSTTRIARAARTGVLLIGLVAAGSALAGSLATPWLTGAAVGVAGGIGAIVAVTGRTQRGMVAGWAGATFATSLLMMIAGLSVGVPPRWVAFAALTFGTAVMMAAAVRNPRSAPFVSEAQTSAVIWSSHGAGLLALALTVGSSGHLLGLMAMWGVAFGVVAGLSIVSGRVTWYAIAASYVAAWLFWIPRDGSTLDHVEVYSLPAALFSLAAGLAILRRRPGASNWILFGPALILGFGPSVVAVLTNDRFEWRHAILLAAGIAAVAVGWRKAIKATLIVGSIVLLVVGIHALAVTAWP